MSVCVDCHVHFIYSLQHTKQQKQQKCFRGNIGIPGLLKTQCQKHENLTGVLMLYLLIIVECTNNIYLVDDVFRICKVRESGNANVQT